MSNTTYSTSFEVTWGDLDANVHLRNVGYLDYAAQTRFRFFVSQQFGPQDFARNGVGPVVLEETIRYRKELKLMEVFFVEQWCIAMNEDHSRFHILNRFLKEDGTLCAEVETKGAWFNVKTRRIGPAPEGLRAAMDAMPRTAEFHWMASNGT